MRGYASKHRYKMLEKTREVGSGLNDRRPKPLHILRVTERMVDVIIVEDKDGLTGFGFNYHLAKFRGSHGVRIETVFDDVTKKDATQEPVEDTMSLVQSFFSAARLHGRGRTSTKRLSRG